MSKIIVLTHNAKIPFSTPRYFTGWVAGTSWPEYVKSPAQAKLMSPGVAHEAASVIKSMKFKARVESAPTT